MLRGFVLTAIGLAVIALSLGNLIAHRSEPERTLTEFRQATATLLQNRGLPAAAIPAIRSRERFPDGHDLELTASQRVLLDYSGQLIDSVETARANQAREAGQRTVWIVCLGVLVLLFGMRMIIREEMRMQGLVYRS